MSSHTLLEMFGHVVVSFTRGVAEHYNPDEPEFTSEPDWVTIITVVHGTGGRERLYCFPLFAHDRLITTSVTSHSNGTNLRLAWFILVPIALFSSLSRWGLGTRIEGLWRHRIFELNLNFLIGCLKTKKS